MKIELTHDQARVWMGFIDTTLKVKGVDALDAAALFKLKIMQAEQEEKNEHVSSQRESQLPVQLESLASGAS